MANQRRLWSDMYARLVPELVSEYEGLVKKQKSSKSSGIGIHGNPLLTFLLCYLLPFVLVEHVENNFRSKKIMSVQF